MGDHSRFAVFILTHGRPTRQLTLDSLEQAGDTGRVYFIIDNEDSTADEYRARFGAANVIQFDKRAIAQTFDTADTQEDRRTIVYARNACFGIAKDLGLDYFLELDDDYNYFRYRYVEDGVECWPWIRSFDRVVDAMLTFLDDSGAATVAFAQGGDFIGGGWGGGNLRKGLMRKAMNSLFLRTDRPVNFVGRINEDVTAYVLHGSRGDLFLTFTGISLDQSMTQSASGGMSDVYLDGGTYLKSFYTVMMAPSCVQVREMGEAHRRLHHAVRWDCAVPKILSGMHKKRAVEHIEAG